MTSRVSLPADGLPQSQLRFAYLISQYPAVSHTFILREVRALRDRNITVDVASINDAHDPAQLTSIEREEAARTFYVKHAGALGALRALFWLTVSNPLGIVKGLRAAMRLGGTDPRLLLQNLFYFLEAAIMTRWMRGNSLRHLHVHFATPAAAVGVIVTAMAPITLSITVHGPDEFYDVTRYSLVQKFDAARFIVCISFFAQSQVMKFTPSTKWKNIDVARLGVDCEAFRPRPSMAQQHFNILCVGRLVAAKGQRILIEAVEQLDLAGRSVRLVLVGDGPDASYLRELVRLKKLDHIVTFAGSVNQDNIQEFYRQADVFAMASFAEGIPVVLMEAMAMEIPSVATRVMGIPELIDDGENGLLVAPSDVNGLAEALTRLMDDRTFAETLGRAGRIRVSEAYELGKSADRLAAIFRERLAGCL